MLTLILPARLGWEQQQPNRSIRIPGFHAIIIQLLLEVEDIAEHVCELILVPKCIFSLKTPHQHGNYVALNAMMQYRGTLWQVLRSDGRELMFQSRCE